MRFAILTSFFPLLSLFWFLGKNPVEARIFDMSKERHSSYFKGDYTQITFDQQPFSLSSGNGFHWDKKFSSATGIEVGYVYMPGHMGWRLGVQFLDPTLLSQVQGTDSTTGNIMYTLESNTTLLFPKFGWEVVWGLSSTHRWFLLMAYGLGNLTVDNAYTFTNVGTASTGLSDFQEIVNGSAPIYELALSYEGFLSDTTTVCWEVGYRLATFEKLTHNQATTTFQGPVQIGDPANKMDGTPRTLDFSGYFLGLAFRFWL